ncbi:hypothetical protein M758_UG035700 [Ceratodon purpureus]|nr:hypothetical protein M758_UG035700 [Ceratodon purpureus]
MFTKKCVVPLKCSCDAISKIIIVIAWTCPSSLCISYGHCLVGSHNVILPLCIKFVLIVALGFLEMVRVLAVHVLSM